MSRKDITTWFSEVTLGEKYKVRKIGGKDVPAKKPSDPKQPSPEALFSALNDNAVRQAAVQAEYQAVVLALAAADCLTGAGDVRVERARQEHRDAAQVQCCGAARNALIEARPEQPDKFRVGQPVTVTLRQESP